MAIFLTLSRDFWQQSDLDALQPWMPGSIQRVFYIADSDEAGRLGAGDSTAWQAYVCLRGSCRISVGDGLTETDYHLEDPFHCLIVPPTDTRTLDDFSEDTILLVLSNQADAQNDFLPEKKKRKRVWPTTDQAARTGETMLYFRPYSGWLLQIPTLS